MFRPNLQKGPAVTLQCHDFCGTVSLLLKASEEQGDQFWLKVRPHAKMQSGNKELKSVIKT